MGQTRDRLSKLAGQPKLAHLTRGYPGDPTHNGFVLGLGRDLVLLQVFHDFYSEGYTALRVADIKRVRSGKHERFFEKMFRGEGLMEQVGLRYDVSPDDFRSLLTTLHRQGRHVTISCESKETADDDLFLIGWVAALDEESVSLRHFDPEGAWYDELEVITYGDITQVQFDTPYSNTFIKYLEPPPPGSGLALGSSPAAPPSPTNGRS